MAYAVSVIAGYLLGSVIFSVVVGKLFKGTDIRKHGSGNAGATNTLRVLGLGPAVLVLALDIGKGILGVWIGKWLSGGESDLIPALAGLSVIAGHNWPVFFKFRGGKGIAATIGVVATLCFWPAFIAGMIAIASIVVTRYVSLGSLIFTALLPLFVWLLHWPNEILLASFVIFAFAWFRHRSNLVKLWKGQENKLGGKRQTTKEA